MIQCSLLSVLIVTFVSVVPIQLTAAKNGLRRRETSGISPKYNVQLTVANRKHYKQDSGIGDEGFETRIIGGNPTDPLEYPYFTDLGGCGATLIAPNVILSAGKANE
jgi:hypothetical protein